MNVQKGFVSFNL